MGVQAQWWAVGESPLFLNVSSTIQTHPQLPRGPLPN